MSSILTPEPRSDRWVDLSSCLDLEPRSIYWPLWLMFAWQIDLGSHLTWSSDLPARYRFPFHLFQVNRLWVSTVLGLLPIPAGIFSLWQQFGEGIIHSLPSPHLGSTLALSPSYEYIRYERMLGEEERFCILYLHFPCQ